MRDRIHPKAEANRITKIVQAVLGEGAYPLNVADVLLELAPTIAGGSHLEIVYRDLRSIEGALLPGAGGDRWTILINNSIENHGRKNFTIAHEAGHFLCHRRLNQTFECSAEKINRFADAEAAEADLEQEANEFASQLLLPPTIVRRCADADRVTFDSVAELADSLATSVVAAARACVSVSSKPIGFAVVRDGFVSWGRASDSAYKMGLYFKKGAPVPTSSRFSPEFGASNVVFSEQRVDGAWLDDCRVLESGFYSSRYGEAYVVLDLKPH